MQEELQQPTKNPRRISKKVFQSNIKIFTAVILGLIIGLSIWGAYSKGYNKGKTESLKINKKSSSTPQVPSNLLALPASGEVSKISENSITVKLLGNEDRTATINNKTVITEKSSNISVNKIKVGSKVILFTNEENKNIIATRIIIQ